MGEDNLGTGAGSSLTMGYFVSLHYVLTQFHGSMEVKPSSLPERIFAIFTLIMGMLTLSMLVSTTTDTIFQIRLVRREEREKSTQMRAFFTHHLVSAEVMFGAKAYIAMHRKSDVELEDEPKFLSTLPSFLRKTIMWEVRYPTIKSHHLFAWIQQEHSSAMRLICASGLRVLAHDFGTLVFDFDDACDDMYF